MPPRRDLFRLFARHKLVFSDPTIRDRRGNEASRERNPTDRPMRMCQQYKRCIPRRRSGFLRRPEGCRWSGSPHTSRCSSTPRSWQPQWQQMIYCRMVRNRSPGRVSACRSSGVRTRAGPMDLPPWSRSAPRQRA